MENSPNCSWVHWEGHKAKYKSIYHLTYCVLLLTRHAPLQWGSRLRWSWPEGSRWACPQTSAAGLGAEPQSQTSAGRWGCWSGTATWGTGSTRGHQSQSCLQFSWGGTSTVPWSTSSLPGCTWSVAMPTKWINVSDHLIRIGLHGLNSCTVIYDILQCVYSYL